MANIYLPEGRLLDTDTNRLHTASFGTLCEAMEKGTILEAIAEKCDSDRNIYVNFGFCTGRISRSEMLYLAEGEQIKDIAIITRVGKPICFKVVSVYDKDGKPDVILSRRLAQKECAENMVNFLDEGDVIDASVTHMEQFGAFCDIGCGLIGLLPIDCISVSRISHPSDRFKNGSHIRAVIKSNDTPTHRVTLSHKELLGTWRENAELFHAGETVSGIIRSVEPYGIFVELTPNLAGLAEWSDGVNPGQKAAVYIKSIIPEKNKVKLVLVDTSDFVKEPSELKYFISSSNVASWSYFQ